MCSDDVQGRPVFQGCASRQYGVTMKIRPRGPAVRAAPREEWSQMVDLSGARVVRRPLVVAPQGVSEFRA
jgi:hypothetical protein